MKSRVISCLILIPLMAVCVILSAITRTAFFLAAGLLCVYELYTNLKNKEIHILAPVLFGYLVCHALLSYFRREPLLLLGLFLFCFYLILTVGVFLKKTDGKDVMFTLSALAYPCIPFACLIYIVTSDIWAETLLFACISTWVCDSFAMSGGKHFGKHKVAPSVSPNKTVEGCVCGALSSVLTGLVIYFVLKLPVSSFSASGIQRLSPLCCILIAFVVSTAGQVGDLAESLIKRSLNIKDFSNLIPGHGGMLDRADSLLFSIPTAYFCIRALLSRL